MNVTFMFSPGACFPEFLPLSPNKRFQQVPLMSNFAPTRIVRLFITALLAVAGVISAQAAPIAPWGFYSQKPDDWFSSDKAQEIIANVLSWQDVEGAG